MHLDDNVYRGNLSSYDKALHILAHDELPPEKWVTNSNANQSDCNILRYYLERTFEKLWNERESVATDQRNCYIYEDLQQMCFNTGLLDKHWQNIYYYCIKNNRPNVQKWKFKCFYNSYTINSFGAARIQAQAVEALRRPNYFENPSDLVFDVKLEIVPQWNHIIGDAENFNRIPEGLRINGNEFCRNLLDGAIRTSKKRIEANYKIAVPQWYRGKIQLLVPIYLTNEKTPDLALVVSKSEDGSQYQGHTCLTIEMAYINARQITKPESFWLLP